MSNIKIDWVYNTAIKKPTYLPIPLISNTRYLNLLSSHCFSKVLSEKKYTTG